MSEFLEKHKQSLKSADILSKQHYYSSVVNRSYYACIQYLLHIIFHNLKEDKVKFYADARYNKEGTHGWASKLIELDMAHNHKDDYKWFQVKIKEFKKLRVRADYFEDIIGQDEGLNSINTANAIINVVAKAYK